MWKLRKAKDYFDTEQVAEKLVSHNYLYNINLERNQFINIKPPDTKAQGQTRDSISKNTVKGFLERLSLSEEWLLKQLLGDSFVVRAAALNVKVSAKKANSRPENYLGDLYVVQNLKNGMISFKLYSLEENRFIWSVDALSNLDGYLDLKCNTHILHLGDSIYTFKFPDKKERTLFRDNLNKFMYFEKAKK